MADVPTSPKTIQQIQVGAVAQDKVGWILTYASDVHESFALHLPIAKQFHEALGACIVALEQAQARGNGMQSTMGMGERVTVQLSPPAG